MGLTVILGAGLSGLSVSYHLGHGNCMLLEQAGHAFGHVKSGVRAGFTWDEGPHVSFTKHEYVRALFAGSVNGEFDEFEVRVGNHYRGHWIDHPAQVSLHQVPEPLRAQCLESFLRSRERDPAPARPAADYGEWLERAFGSVFARALPGVYTEKYWTRRPADLTTDWVGDRVLYPSVDDVVAGARGPLGRSAHYITRVRYPRRGGYESFARGLHTGANVRLGAKPVRIELAARTLHFADGAAIGFDRLVNTIPLPEFIRLCADVPAAVREAADALSCTELLIVNLTARHPARRPETWLYVYDEDKLATRINFTEHLTPGNAPAGTTGVQTEVYASRHRPFPAESDELARRVQAELVEMGLVEEALVTGRHTVDVRWANVIFDHETKPALEAIWQWLEGYGLAREPDDTHPLTDWTAREGQAVSAGAIACAGRFGQWKYFWTDDCVLRGRRLAGLG
jgi:protoporphyrinogen oxidase